MRDILRDQFEVSCSLPNDFTQIPLTRQPFMFNAVQLYELLMVVETCFQKYFSAEEIKENGFSTIEDIILLIQKYDKKSIFL